MSELKPCPFCGGEATYSTGSLYHKWTVSVRCRECGARTVAEPFGNNGTLAYEQISGDGKEAAREKVAERWNRRVE